jgi:tRNA(Ile)-lysidine synthase
MLPSFAARVQETIKRYGMLEQLDRVLVGVSGGADSVALLLVLRELDYTVGVGHVNHGLRGAASDEDEAFTAHLCAGLGVPFFCKRLGIKLMGGNLEAAGRDARRKFFVELVAQNRFTKLALAHTRDDRTETFLMNLLRGAGSDGLVAMAAKTGDVIRPLIETGKMEIESYLTALGQPWRTDATNEDTRFTRNRLRSCVIPEFTAAFNPRLKETIARTTEILEAENIWMQQLCEDWIGKHGTQSAQGLVLDARALAAEPVGLQRRVLRAALRSLGSGLENVGFDHVEAARALLEPGKSGKVVELPGWQTVSRSFEDLIVQSRKRRGGAAGPSAGFSYDLQIPGEVHIPDLRWIVKAEILTPGEANYSSKKVFVDGGKLGPYVRIRTWKPGDYYRPVGLPAGKLKKLFQRARIPRSERERWPVLVADSSIFWVASFPVSRDFAPRGSSQKIVAFEAILG